MDRFADLQTFVHIVAAGSISGAAEHMDMAKSAVSRRLAELEERLGVQLVRRTTRSLSLTESGRGFYERCLRILADLEEAEQDVLQAHAALRGTLRVALPLSFGLLHLAPAIQAFMALHPEVEFDLDFNDRQVDLLQEGFDVAIRIAQLPDSSLIARRIAPIRQVVCASPAYFAAHAIPQQPAELVQHVCLAYSNLANPGTWVYQQADGRRSAVKIPIRLKSNNGDFLVSAALAGLGIVMQPSFYVHQLIESGALIPVLSEIHWPEINAYALYPSTRHLSTRVRAFVDFVAERFAGTPYWDRVLSPPAPNPR
jgi:DNA-binding transcriptional LysR family regulator